MVRPAGFEPATYGLEGTGHSPTKHINTNTLQDPHIQPSPLASPRNQDGVPEHLNKIMAALEGLNEQERGLLLALLIRKV